TIEEGAVGGFGSHVAQFLTDQGMLDSGLLKFRTMVLPDVFLDHDTPNAMYARAGLDAKGIVAKVFEALGKDVKTATVKLACGWFTSPACGRGGAEGAGEGFLLSGVLDCGGT